MIRLSYALLLLLATFISGAHAAQITIETQGIVQSTVGPNSEQVPTGTVVQIRYVIATGFPDAIPGNPNEGSYSGGVVSYEVSIPSLNMYGSFAGGTLQVFNDQVFGAGALFVDRVVLNSTQALGSNLFNTGATSGSVSFLSSYENSPPDMLLSDQVPTLPLAFTTASVMIRTPGNLEPTNMVLRPVPLQEALVTQSYEAMVVSASGEFADNFRFGDAVDIRYVLNSLAPGSPSSNPDIRSYAYAAVETQISIPSRSLDIQAYDSGMTVYNNNPGLSGGASYLDIVSIAGNQFDVANLAGNTATSFYLQYSSATHPSNPLMLGDTSLPLGNLNYETIFIQLYTASGQFTNLHLIRKIPDQALVDVSENLKVVSASGPLAAAFIESGTIDLSYTLNTQASRLSDINGRANYQYGIVGFQLQIPATGDVIMPGEANLIIGNDVEVSPGTSRDDLAWGRSTAAGTQLDGIGINSVSVTVSSADLTMLSSVAVPGAAPDFDRIDVFVRDDNGQYTTVLLRRPPAPPVWVDVEHTGYVLANSTQVPGLAARGSQIKIRYRVNLIAESSAQNAIGAIYPDAMSDYEVEFVAGAGNNSGRIVSFTDGDLRVINDQVLSLNSYYVDSLTVNAGVANGPADIDGIPLGNVMIQLSRIGTTAPDMLTSLDIPAGAVPYSAGVIVMAGGVINFQSAPVIIDSDLDGVLDSVDACPASYSGDTVMLNGNDSGVANSFGEDGCSVTDKIMTACSAEASQKGKFASCVTQVSNDLRRGGVISGRESGLIQAAAGR